MRSVNIHEAKTHFSRLVDSAAAGESIIIAKAGHPVAKLTPLDPVSSKSGRTGFLLGQIHVSDDFDRMDETDIADRFDDIR